MTMMMMTTTDDDADDDYKYDGHGGGDRDGDDYADDDNDEKDDEGYEDDCDATGIFKLDYLCDAFKVVFARLMASTASRSCDLRMVTIWLLAASGAPIAEVAAADEELLRLSSQTRIRFIEISSILDFS